MPDRLTLEDWDIHLTTTKGADGKLYIDLRQDRELIEVGGDAIPTLIEALQEAARGVRG